MIGRPQGSTFRWRFTRHSAHAVTLAAAFLVATGGPPSASADLVDTQGIDDADALAAQRLLRQAVTVAPDGRHHRLLRALRFLEDPELQPLFARLREDNHAALRVHGLLGAAELATPRGLTPEDLIDLERDDQRAEVIGAALDGGLLGDETLDALLAWPGLPPQIKLLLATPRVAAGQVEPGSPAHAAMLAALEEGAGHAAPGQRGLAALLLHQIGDARGTRALIELNNSDAPTRDPVRATLLETARAHHLTRASTWAFSVASEPGLPPRLEALALSVAAAFGDVRAHRRWAEHYAAARDADPTADRSRLALAALDFAVAAAPETFTDLATDPDPFVATAGVAGQALAADGTTDPPTDALLAALTALRATNNPQAHAWLARYAADEATPVATAVAVAQDLITGYRRGRERGRTRRLQAVLDATETLLRRSPDAAALLAAALRRPEADDDIAWTQAVLLGVIHIPGAPADTVSTRLPAFQDPDCRALAMLLRLRADANPVAGDQATLGRVLGGRTGLDDELRVQAAWGYLKRTRGANALPSATPPDRTSDLRLTP